MTARRYRLLLSAVDAVPPTTATVVVLVVGALLAGAWRPVVTAAAVAALVSWVRDAVVDYGHRRWLPETETAEVFALDVLSSRTAEEARTALAEARAWRIKAVTAGGPDAVREWSELVEAHEAWAEALEDGARRG